MTGRCLLIILLAVLLAAPARGDFDLREVAHLFPSEGFEDQIEFWREIFTRYGQNEVVLHDRSDLRLIYKVVRFEQGIEGNDAEARRQRKLLEAEIEQLRGLFSDMIRWGPYSDRLTPRHRELRGKLRTLGYPMKGSVLRGFRDNIRYQRGIREKFRAGIVRSGRYLDIMQEIFREKGLPVQLTHLVHVESSFSYWAYSHRGAAGIWQFTRGTGRRYFRMNRYVDERLDPLKATRAAADLLQQSHRKLGNWPLAITAYNHGENGMLRAKERHGEDLREIIRHYRSPYFGFASKNFYAEFLAALEVAENHPKYFGELELEPPMEFDTIPLKAGFHISHFTQVRGLNEEILRQYNPHIRPLVWERTRILPAGTDIRVPAGYGPRLAAALEAATPAAAGGVEVAADGSLTYRVQPGDSLTAIARQLGVGVSDLQALNPSLRNPHLIYAGQVLHLPGSGKHGGITRYRVRRGDTLARIARRFGTTIQRLQELNGLDDPHRIFLGQLLLIP